MNRTEYTEATALYLRLLPSTKASPATVTNYGGVLRDFGNFLEKSKSNEIAPLTIAEYRQTVIDRGACLNSARRYVATLRTFFAWCARNKLIDGALVDSAEIPAREQIEYNLLTLDEIEALIHYHPRVNSARDCKSHAIAVLLVQTGLRNDELRSLALSDVDFERKTVTVRHGKGNKKRVVALPPDAEQALAVYLASGARPNDLKNSDFLFGSAAGTDGHPTNSGAWHKLSSAALLGCVNRHTRRVCGHEVSVHALRHAATAYLDYLGASMRDVQATLGHSSVATTEKIYNYVLDPVRTAAAINSIYAARKMNFQKRDCPKSP